MSVTGTNDKGETMFTKYATEARARRETGKRSLKAAMRGECSQYEIRKMASGTFIAGYAGDLARLWGHLRIIAQYSGGYSC